MGSGPAQTGTACNPATVTCDPSHPANAAGWHKEPFTVTFTHAVLTCDPQSYNGPDSANPPDLTTTCTDPADPDVLPPETGTYSFKYDETAPTVDVNPPNGSGPVHTEPFNVALTWNAGVSGEAQGCPANVTYSGGPQDVTCTDNAGNSTTETLQYPYDASGPPSISIDSGPANGSVTGDQNPTFTFSSNEAGVQFRCEIDTSTFQPCSSPHSPGPLADGPHTFRVLAVDQTGLQSPTETRSWQILQVPQNTAPPTIVGFPGEAETLAADQGQWLGGTPVLTLLTHWQSCDAGGGGCSDIGTGPTYLVKAADVGRRIRVRVEANNPATEALGNPIFAESELTAVVTPLDRNLPLTTILGRPANPTNRQRAVFTFQSSRAGSTFECSLDGGVFQPCLSGRTYTALAPGLHTFGVKATFQANNGEIFRELSPAAWVWRIDLVRPPAPTSVVARGGDAKVFLFWTPPRVADVAGTQVGRTRVRTPGLAVVRFLTGSRFTDRSVRNGVLYRYSLRTRDRAGNRSDARVVYARPRDPLIAPRDGAIVTSNPLLDWVGRPHATYYNVQVHRVVANGPDVKVLTKWPVATRYRIPPRWFYLRWRSLGPGVYIWRVWPGFGSPQNEQYGRMIGSSVFTKR